MRNFLLLAITLLSFSLNTYGQLQIIYGEPFDSLRNQALEKYELEEYSEAVRFYDKAYELLGDSFPCIIFYQYAFLASTEAKEIDRAIYYLKRYANLSIFSESQYEKLLSEDRFAEILLHSEWPKIEESIIEKRLEYGAIYDKLLFINDSDQTLRILSKCADNNLQNESQRKYLLSLIAREDSLNLIYLDSIVNEYGWLGIYKVGEDGSSAMWKVVQHSSLDVQEKYLPMIRESVMKGETSRAELAFLEDRINLYRGKYQVYGTQIVKDDDGNYKVFPIQDPANVDEKRKELGFEPLVEYLDFWDIVIESEEDLQLDYLLEKWKKS